MSKKPTVKDAWDTIELTLNSKGVSPSGRLAMQGMFCNGYECGIEHVMAHLEGTHDVMSAVAVVNGMLRDVRRLKQDAVAAGQTMLAIHKMRGPMVLDTPLDESQPPDSDGGTPD